MRPECRTPHLADDPMEQNNLAATQPEVLTRLKALYDDWFDAFVLLLADLGQGERPTADLDEWWWQGF